MENTNELLWIDEKAIKKEKEQIVKGQMQLNEFIDESKSILGDLSKEDMIKLKDERFSYLESKVEKLFEHPKAKRDFNLQALGIEPQELDSLKKYNSALWNPYKYEIVNGKFLACEEQPYLQRYRYYADTEQKKQMLRVAQQIVDSANDAKKLDMVNTEHYRFVSVAFNGLIFVDGYPGGNETTLKVNKKGIGNYVPLSRKTYLEL